MLYPRVRVFTLLTLGFFVTSVAVPAWVMLIYWAFLQLASGLLPSAGQGGVAVWAHVGGFMAGLLLVKPFAMHSRVASHRANRWEPRRIGW
jgi:rhomboid family protein